MKLTVFQSEKGDCLLLTGEGEHRILIDGGMQASYSKYVAPALGRLRDDGRMLDIVYVSHVDADHISGVLQLMDDEVAWRIHEYQMENGNPQHQRPAAPRPPKVNGIWHNAFHEQVRENAGEIEEMLAASAAVLSGSETTRARAAATAQNSLATSIGQAIKLTRRVGMEQLDIKLNAPANGKLMLVASATAPEIKLGKMRFYIIGPFPGDLRKLRAEWNAWLEKNRAIRKSIETQTRKEASRFHAGEIDDILAPKLMQAELWSEALSLKEASKPAKLGEREKVTTPNLASLMFFVEENGRTLLLTGDGHHTDIMRGLQRLKKIDGKKGLHLNVLKVQHHASEYNIDEAFCRAITADHYIFCGNGEHKNPDLRVLQAIADSRLGSDAQVSTNPDASRPFKFWFNSHSSVTAKREARDHMKSVESLVGKLSKTSNGKMSFFFLKGSSFDVEI